MLDKQKIVFETLGDFKNEFKKVVSEMKTGYIVAMLTDEFDIQDIASDEFVKKESYSEKLFEKGLEIRVFNRSREVKWFRTNISEKLICRDKTDGDVERFVCGTKEYAFDYWDERQYLDIDEKKSNPLEQKAVSTGGGCYHLPIPAEWYKDTQIIIRNYLGYEKETNQIFISDWRLVDFVREGEE